MTPAALVLAAAIATCSSPPIPRYEPPAPLPVELEPAIVEEQSGIPTGCPCDAEGTSFGDFCCYIFTDGFFTGDTSRWDETVGGE